MAAFKVLAGLLLLATIASAQLAGGNGGYGHDDHYNHHPKYDFKYGVHDTKTHDIKSHSEHRDGDKTEGEYSLLEADGTTRTVKYYVDGKSGFVATVHRSGHAAHPQQVHHVAPVVHHVAPVVHHVAPVVHHVAPVVHHVAPVVHHAVHHAAPVSHHSVVQHHPVQHQAFYHHY